MIIEEDWDQHFEPTKRELRHERKRISRNGRSQEKKVAISPRIEEEPQKGLQVGRVLVAGSQAILVASGPHQYSCSIKGTLKKYWSQQKNLVVPGDIVDFCALNATEGIIHRIQQRTSFLSRQDHLDRVKQQVIAANADQLVVVLAVAEPTFAFSFVDRYLIAAQKGQMQPLILINKWDLCSKYSHEAKVAESCLTLYQDLGIPIMVTSAQTEKHLEVLYQALKGKVSVFSGQSGTGKTLLINRLTHASLPIGPIRAIGKGSHTTSSSQLIPLPDGGWVLDTPGIRSFGIYDLTEDDLRKEYLEIFSQPCAFSGCRHTQKERGCAIPKALRSGTISMYRYASYLSLVASLKERPCRR